MNELTAILSVGGGDDTLRGVWRRQRIDRNTGRRAAVQFFSTYAVIFNYNNNK